MNDALSDLASYCIDFSTASSEVLKDLERETHLKTLAPQMISGPLQGRWLAMISHMIRPRRILEIGTFTGYTAINLALGLQDGGILHTIEANRELEYLIRKYISAAQLDEKVVLHIGKAENVLPELPGPFDLVFIDAGKNDNALHYDLVFEKVKPGGFILVDNVLWSGKVVHKRQDKDTAVIHQFNEKVNRDPRVENLILPIRDGLMMVRKM